MNNPTKCISLMLLLSSASLSCSQDMFDDIFDQMQQQMQKTQEHMSQMWTSMDKFMEEALSTMPNSRTSGQMPVDINYDDPKNVLVTIKLSDRPEEVDAEVNKKRNSAKISIPQQDRDTTITIDRFGMKFTSQQKFEKKTKGEDEKESTHMSFTSQQFYQSFQTHVDAAKAEVKIKNNEVIITLPREESIKKLSVKREE